MDLRRLRVGEWLAAASGVALLVSLFLPWYEPGAASAWEALAVTDVLLALVAASGVLLALVTATQGAPAVPIAVSALVTLAGGAGVLLALWRVLDLPGGVDGREPALWLGLVAAVGVAAGAAVAMRDERLPGATGREIEPIPAPRP